MNNIPTQTNLFSISNMAKYILAPTLAVSLASCSKPKLTTDEIRLENYLRSEENKKQEQIKYKQELDQAIMEARKTLPDEKISIAEDFLEAASAGSLDEYGFVEKLGKLPKDLKIKPITNEDFRIINQLAIVEKLPKQPRNLNDLETQGLYPLFKATMFSYDFWANLDSRYNLYLDPKHPMYNQDVTKLEYFIRDNRNIEFVRVYDKERHADTATVFFFYRQQNNQN